MIKLAGAGTRNGKPIKLVVLGLSHVNLKRLKEGKPIMFPGEEIEVENVQFIIFAGKDEMTMQQEMADLIGPKTRTNIDPRFRH